MSHPTNLGPRLVAMGGLLAGVVLCATSASAQGDVTFTRDVLPILQTRCQGCHRVGHMAPMSLVTYDEVRPWARAIRTRVMDRSMPPWHIDKTIGIQGVPERHLAERGGDRDDRRVGRRGCPARQPRRHTAAGRLAGRRRLAAGGALRSAARSCRELPPVDTASAGPGSVVATGG